MKRIVSVLALALLTFGCGESPKNDAPGAAKPNASTPAAKPAESLAQPSAQAGAQAAQGGAQAKVDSDDDGVSDDLDKCASTPPGMAVSSDGCIKDQDKDGVADNQDACPSSPVGQAVDDRGCVPRLKSAREFAVAITFASGSAEVDAAIATKALREPIRLAKSYPNSQVQVYAYTDSSGPSAANQALSQQRAESVADFVVGKGGIARNRVKAIGKGEADPVASNDTRTGRAANRRIVVVVVPGGVS